MKSSRAGLSRVTFPGPPWAGGLRSGPLAAVISAGRRPRHCAAPLATCRPSPAPSPAHVPRPVIPARAAGCGLLESSGAPRLRWETNYLAMICRRATSAGAAVASSQDRWAALVTPRLADTARYRPIRRAARPPPLLKYSPVARRRRRRWLAGSCLIQAAGRCRWEHASTLMAWPRTEIDDRPAAAETARRRRQMPATRPARAAAYYRPRPRPRRDSAVPGGRPRRYGPD